MFIPALIFVFSLAVTIKFAIYSWRARMLRFVSSVVAEETPSSGDNLLRDKAFPDLAAYQDLCPSLDGGSRRQLGAVGLYYKTLKFLGSAQWAKDEMALCAKYASAVLTERMQHNQALAAEVQSF